MFNPFEGVLMNIFKKSLLSLGMFKNLREGKTSILCSGKKATATKYWKDPKTGKEYVITEKVKSIADMHADRLKTDKLIYPPDGNNSIMAIELIEE